MALNKSGTFVYSPDIRVNIATVNGGYLDVSSDIIDFTMQRQINAVSTFQMTLANPGRKYNRKINTMDRIVVFLKRTNYVQTFSGYVVYAPIETLVPTPVTIVANCTLRIIQNTYWDNTLIQFQQLLLNYFDNTLSTGNSLVGDGGIAQVMVNLLNRVAGWDESKIHIQKIPENFLTLAGNLYSEYSGNNEYLSQTIIPNLVSFLAAGYASSNNQFTGSVSFGGSHTLTYSGAPNDTSITARYAHGFITPPIGKGQKDYPGPNPHNPVFLDNINADRWYCSVQFPYLKETNSAVADAAKAFFTASGQQPNGRILLVSNANKNKVVAVRITSVLQEPGKKDKYGNAVPIKENVDYIQCHPSVVQYLNGAIDDPNNWDPNGQHRYHNGHVSPIFFEYPAADKNVTVGVQKDIEQQVSVTNSGITNNLSGTPGSTVNATSDIQKVINFAIANKGAQYGRGFDTNHQKEFDCSLLLEAAYASIGIKVGNLAYRSKTNQGGTSQTMWGNGNPSDNTTCGMFIDKNNPSLQPGDLLFWDISSDKQTAPQHVSMVVSPPSNGTFNVIQAHGTYQHSGRTIPIDITPLKWSDIKGGPQQFYYDGNVKVEFHYMGARRPISIKYPTGLTSVINNLDPAINATTDSTRMIALNNAINNLFALSPQYDIRASVLAGSPRAFLLDNPLLSDLQTVVGAGLRQFMSAPNGDFVAWFPDYYGAWGTDPVISISDVEILDFQIYHDDNQLVTHYGVVGDTNGVGQQVNVADYMTTQGIVSIEQQNVMQLLLNGKTSDLLSYLETSQDFLRRYGMRPKMTEQNIIHSHGMEYLYAIYGFMNQWTNQFASNVSLTFMPELYPGMRISLTLDNESGGTDEYQFYVNEVTHQGSRSGGFITQAQLTAPVKNGKILNYGLDLG